MNYGAGMHRPRELQRPRLSSGSSRWALKRATGATRRPGCGATQAAIRWRQGGSAQRLIGATVGPGEPAEQPSDGAIAQVV